MALAQLLDAYRWYRSIAITVVEMAPTVAFIDEARCIGCTKCLPPCPVDAIAGAPRRMHTVIAELCTGCELCVAPCPVDCIVMIPLLARPLPVAGIATGR